MKVVGLVNYYVLVNCYAHGPTGQYSVLIFHIPTVFDIIPLELVRFWNFWYSVNSCSFSCPTLPLLFSFSYSNVEIENGWEVFRPFSSLLVVRTCPQDILQCVRVQAKRRVQHTWNLRVYVKLHVTCSIYNVTAINVGHKTSRCWYYSSM
jgi:hypothetical protein